MSYVTPELVERMTDLIRNMGQGDGVFPSLSSMDHYIEAQNIVSRLSDADTDLEIARRVAADHMIAADPSFRGSWEKAMLAGQLDEGNMVGIARAGIKRGRELATNQAAMRVNSNGEQ